MCQLSTGKYESNVQQKTSVYFWIMTKIAERKNSFSNTHTDILVVLPNSRRNYLQSTSNLMLTNINCAFCHFISNGSHHEICNKLPHYNNSSQIVIMRPIFVRFSVYYEMHIEVIFIHKLRWRLRHLNTSRMSSIIFKDVLKVEYQLKPYMPDVIDEMPVLKMAHTSLTSYRFNFQQHILPIQRSVWHPISCVCFVFVLVCYTQN